MGQPLRFQVLVIPNVPWSEYLDRFVRVEELGFDVAAVPDHFCDWGNPTGPWLEAWTSIAAIAARTSRIRLTTCVTQMPLRNPAVLAHQAVTVDQICGGRVELGLGTGIAIDPSYTMIGVDNWTGAERSERFGEYVELITRLVSQPVTHYDGRHYQAHGAVMNPGPVQTPRLPIMVAALGPRMLRHAVRHADIWNSLSFATDFEAQLGELIDRCQTVDELCAELGRDPNTLRRSYTMFDPTARASGGAIAYYESDDLFVEMVKRVIECGIDEISIYYPALAAQLPAFERIARDVIPELRGGHG
jgi:alkanesulfonate monooxygenase SsuD/methylene tetrahydromethanopterin reductase-like flavin-dependent oxidoreductase (luciferase family)